MNNKSHFFIAANWKMNLSYQESSHYLDSFMELLKSNNSLLKDKNIIFYPQSFCLPNFFLNLEKYSEILGSSVFWGAQNCSDMTSGAFTGEVSAKHIKAIGCSSVLVGHSERRKIYNESLAIIEKKFTEISSQNLTPLLCIGESLDKRKSGETNNVLLEQLEFLWKTKVFSGDDLLIAYEPVWAIGTGEVANVEQVYEAHQFIKNLISEKLNLIPRVLYGGSVKPVNSKELASVDGVDGFLVGGASLKPDSFFSIIENS